MTEAPGDRATAGAPPAPPESSPTSPKRPRFRPGLVWVLFVLALLGFNIFFGMRATQPESRLRVPYSPFFLDQVDAGHVEEITSKGTAIQGTFTEQQSYEGVGADDPVRDRDPGLRRHRRAVAACSRRRGRRQRPAARHGRALVAEPAARLRADAPLRLPALLAVPTGRERCRTSSARSAARARVATSRQATASPSPTSPASTRRRPS